MRQAPLDQGAAPQPHEGLVVFVHIPKTGGTTLRQVMLRQYGREGVWTLPWNDLAASLARLRRQPHHVRAAVGHVPFGVHEELGTICSYVSVLRDPVERLLSHYYYSLNVPTAPYHDQVVSRRMTLRDYIENSNIAGLINNGQTRMLGAGIRSWSRPTSDDMLEAAKRNLDEQFTVVGLAERFDETLLLMKDALGWGWPLYSSANVNAERPRQQDIPRDTIRAIAERNELDAELYRHAAGRFAADMRKRGESLSNELGVFRALNAAEH